MKAVALVLGIILTAPLFARERALSCQDNLSVQKVVIEKELLIQLYKLPKNSFFAVERMIAGDFESISKKRPKQSYLERLLSKLNGSSHLSRF